MGKYKYNIFTGTFDIASGAIIGGGVSGGSPNCVLYIDSSGNLACTSEFVYSAASTEIQLSNDWSQILGIPQSAGLSLTNTSSGDTSNLTRGLTFNFNNESASVWEFANIYAGSVSIDSGDECGKLVFGVRKSGTVSDAFSINGVLNTINFGNGYLIAVGNTPFTPDAQFQINISNASYTGLIIKGKTAQSGDLIQLLDPSSTTLLKITYDGKLCLGESVSNQKLQIDDGNFFLNGTPASGTGFMLINNNGGFMDATSNKQKFIFSSTNGLLWYTGVASSVFRMQLSTSGYLGLNISPPAQMFHMSKGHLRMDQVTVAGAPTLALGAAGVLNGSYRYIITYVTSVGETNGVNISAAVSPVNQKVELSNIPVSSDSDVIYRRIYRTTANGDIQKYQFLTTIGDNTTTVYTDNTADGSLGISLPGNTTGGLVYLGTTKLMQFDTFTFSLGLSAGTKGFYNTFIGHSCGQAIARGYENTFLGYASGYSLTLGIRNTCIGYAAGYSLTDGTYNTMIGRVAGYFSVSGVHNFYLGNGAGYYATGSYNTCIGSSAGQGVSGLSNYNGAILFGYQSGFGLKGGSNDVFIGYQAGYASTDGDYNICIGYTVGSNLTTGARNILIGNAITAQSASGNDQISIGNLIFGTGTGTGTTASTGFVGIGAPSPLCAFTLAFKTSTATVGDNTIGIIGSSVANRGSRLAYDDSGNAQFGTYLLNNADITQNTSTQTARFTSAQSIRIGLHSTGTSSGIGFYTDVSLTAGNTFTPTQRMIITDDGKIGIANSDPVGQLHIERNNTDYTNTSGAGTHLLLTNANASGITGIMALVNGANSFKIRGDSSGNLTWVSYANAANLGHFFYINGDFGTGSCYMMVGNKGVVIGSAAATTSSQAWLTLTVGGSGAGQAPLKFQSSSGTLLATPEAGAVEFSTDDLYLTITTGTARKGIIFNDGTALTSGKIPRASTNGRLIDGPTPLAGTKVYYVSDSSGGAVTRKLTFVDGILTSET